MNRSTPFARRDRCEVFEHQRGDAPAVMGIVHHERGFGLVAPGPPLVAAPRDELAADFHRECDAVDHVDRREVLEFLRGQRWFGREETAVQAVGRLAFVELEERRLIRRHERTDVRRGAIAEHHGGCPPALVMGEGAADLGGLAFIGHGVQHGSVIAGAYDEGVDRPIAVFAAADLDEHTEPAGHPERRGRLDASLAGIPKAGLADAVTMTEPRLATVDELARVHDADLVERIRAFCADGGGSIDGDTYVVPGSWDTARRAAGAVLDAVDALDQGVADVAFAGSRPPGHHAEAATSMGFCLFNNVAVAAAALVDRGERVVIVDWDVHHGNGTQDIFYDDPEVLYVSTHQSPLYPGTGRLTETGGESAPFTNLNLPFPPWDAW